MDRSIRKTFRPTFTSRCRRLRKRIGDTIVTRRSGQFQMEIMELNQITLQAKSQDQVRDFGGDDREIFWPPSMPR